MAGSLSEFLANELILLPQSLEQRVGGLREPMILVLNLSKEPMV